MKRDTLLALAAAVLLHVGFFWGGEFFKTAAVVPSEPALAEPLPVIELLPLSAAETEPGSPLAASGDTATTQDVTALAATQEIDRPSLLNEAIFLQPIPRIQPPSLPGLAARGGAIAIPSGISGGGGVGQGLTNLFNLADLDEIPTSTVRVSPNYPYDMRRAGVSGEVLVGFIVDMTGHVSDAYAVRATRREFADEALRAVRQWQFKPVRKGGVPVNTRMQIPLVFNLDSN